MSRFCLVFLSSLLLITPAFAEPPTGWQDYYWGLDPSSFEGLEGVETLNNPVVEKFRGEMLVAKFVMKNYVIAGVPYTVLFFFDQEDRFAAYTLSYSSADPSIGESYLELARLLQQKYPGGRSSEGPGSFTYEDNLVRLTLKDDPETGLQTIRVIYLDDNSEELDKL